MKDIARSLANGLKSAFALARVAHYAAPLTMLVMFAFLILGRKTSLVGYTLEGERWPAGAAVVMSLQLGTNGGVQISDGSASFDVVAQQAANLWNNYLGSNVKMITLTTGASAGLESDNMNSVFFSSTFFGQAFGNGTLAITNLSSFGSSLDEVDVAFNTFYQWDSYLPAARSGL